MDTTAATTPRPPRAVTSRWRGPFARWPRSADAALALVVAAFTTLFQEGPGDTMLVRDLGAVPVPVLLVFVAASLAVYWRRSHPLHVVGVGLLSMLVLLPSGFADTGATVAIGLYSTGRYSDRDRWGEAAAAAASAVLVLDGLLSDLPWGEVAFGVAFLFGAWLLGRGRRLRDERAGQWVREQAAERRRVVAEERTRIARELHDVVAHRVSLMTIQAGAAATVADHDPAAARRAMTAVEDAGRQALDELRHLLGVLRPDVDGPELDPQPGLAELPRLVERVRAAGPSVELRAPTSWEQVPSAVQLSTYRIVQEALTNVLKHVGDDARVTVAVDLAEATLHLEVVDDGGHDPRPGDAVGDGHGIIGMRERATLLGGRLTAAGVDGGGFRVSAVLPLRPDGGGGSSHVEATTPQPPHAGRGAGS